MLVRKALCVMLRAVLCLAVLRAPTAGGAVMAKWRDHAAGGLAGALTTVIVYPIDTAKLVLQTNNEIKTMVGAFVFLRDRGLSKTYAGLTPALFGSVPSSALYFGTYEVVKKRLSKALGSNRRHLTNTIAAASGILASSAIYVPKETIKQRMQAMRMGTLTLPAGLPLTASGISRYIYRVQGLSGFFASFQATMLRNIPSNVIRFALYEEIKIHIERRTQGRSRDAALLAAGAVASCVASTLTTPFDVITTRLSTGLLPLGSPVFRSLAQIQRDEGTRALFAGLSTRVVWSALYGGLGLAAFELSKRALSAGPLRVDSSGESLN